MLSFMRKHQKYFFAVITFVIVVTFSFFGTYSTLGGNSVHEQTAFTTVNGDPVSRSELEDMALFIGTDAEDKKLFGGVPGPNFLNDGVIRANFFEPGLAGILIESYSNDLEADFKSRFAKEIRFSPYTHPQVKFVSSSNAWAYFAPQIGTQLEILQKSKDPLSSEAVNARIDLFLAERKFPSPYLKQVLRYQENQNSWIEKDASLDYQDLSLFGYHTIDDWFGSKFVRLISEFIFNAAAIAESHGYRVSKEEALADLMRNSEMSYKENKSNPNIGVASSTEYFDQQLLRMRLDKPKAAKIWQKVLLFRRLFGDVSSAVFVDPVSYESFNKYASQGVEGDLYELPSNLRFSDFKTLQRFETYLEKISKRSKDQKNLLLIPQEFLSVAEVSKKAPELIQKKYQLEIATISKKNLESKVSVKETLAWELDEKNWPQILTQFPELGLKSVSTKEERLTALDRLDEATKGRLDLMTRQKIVAAHPEWIDTYLENAPLRPVAVNLSLRGANSNFEGLEKGEELMALLDKAELGTDSPLLKKISFDKEHFYRVQVIERAPTLEILTFEEANKGSLLDVLTTQNLEIAYINLRTSDPASYQNSDKSWKPFDQVRDQVALSYFGSTLDAIRAQLKLRKDKEKYQNLEGERLSPYRFIGWSNDLLKKFQTQSDLSDTLTRSKEDEVISVENQFKWVKSPLKISRKSEQKIFEGDKLLSLSPKQWSEPTLAPNGSLYFAYIADTAQESGSEQFLQEQIARARFLLGSDAERTYLHTLIPELKEKKAISFNYLYAGSSSLESED